MIYYSLSGKNNKNISIYGEISNGVVIEKKSRFYSYIFNVETESEAQEKIRKIREDNKEARHVIYIYSILENSVTNIRFSDDGEPKGTGTRAIYELLTKEGITNICIVIVRYFGGILLGAGPLSRAYLNTARDALELCSKKQIYNYIDFSLQLSYASYKKMQKILDRYIVEESLQILDIVFNESVEIALKIKETEYDTVTKSLEKIL